MTYTRREIGHLGCATFGHLLGISTWYKNFFGKFCKYLIDLKVKDMIHINFQSRGTVWSWCFQSDIHFLIFYCRSAAYDSSLGACLQALYSNCSDDVVRSTAATFMNVFPHSLLETRSQELKASLVVALFLTILPVIVSFWNLFPCWEQQLLQWNLDNSGCTS